MEWRSWSPAVSNKTPRQAPGQNTQGTRLQLLDTSRHSVHPTPLQKLIQTTREEVNTCFSEIIQDVKKLQMKILDFVEKEEAGALGKLGSSIQQSHNRLLKLEGDSIWLRTLLANRSDQQFLQVSPPPAPRP